MIDSRQPKVSYCLRLCVVLRWNLLCSCFPLIGSQSLKPPAEEILNNDLCPDPVVPHGSKLPAIFSSSNKIMTVSLQRSAKPKDRINSYFFHFRYCIFIEDTNTIIGSFLSQDNNVNATIVRIRSINLNTEPWKFTSSRECSKFIMFRSWGEYGNGYPVMCGRDNLDQYLGPYGHPMILYYHLRDNGISFPLFHSNYGQNYRDQKHIMEFKYMLIYYSLELQQYALDHLQQGCSFVKKETICGEYSCSELETMYQKKMNFLPPPERSIKSATQESLLSTDLMVFLLVLGVFCLTGGLRLKLRQNASTRTVVRHRHRGVIRQPECSIRSPMRDGGTSNSPSESFEQRVTPSLIPNQVGCDIPLNGEYAGSEDLPPPYESTLQPPSYLEATTNTIKS